MSTPNDAHIRCTEWYKDVSTANEARNRRTEDNRDVGTPNDARIRRAQSNRELSTPNDTQKRTRAANLHILWKMVYYKDVKGKYEVLYKHVLKKFIHTGAALGL